jgi:hypothetical protein
MQLIGGNLAISFHIPNRLENSETSSKPTVTSHGHIKKSQIARIWLIVFPPLLGIRLAILLLPGSNNFELLVILQIPNDELLLAEGLKRFSNLPMPSSGFPDKLLD